MESNDKNKIFLKLRRKIQGKYFLEDEIAENGTYVHVIKVTNEKSMYYYTPDFKCIANVFVIDNAGLYNKSTGVWWINNSRMNDFNYRRISKNDFVNAVKKNNNIDYNKFLKEESDFITRKIGDLNNDADRS